MRSFVFVVALVCLACPWRANAYVDPGTGSLLWQMAMAVLVGFGFTLGKIRNFIIRKPHK